MLVLFALSVVLSDIDLWGLSQVELFVGSLFHQVE